MGHALTLQLPALIACLQLPFFLAALLAWQPAHLSSGAPRSTAAAAAVAATGRFASRAAGATASLWAATSPASRPAPGWALRLTRARAVSAWIERA